MRAAMVPKLVAVNSENSEAVRKRGGIKHDRKKARNYRPGPTVYSKFEDMVEAYLTSLEEKSHVNAHRRFKHGRNVLLRASERLPGGTGERGGVSRDERWALDPQTGTNPLKNMMARSREETPKPKSKTPPKWNRNRFYSEFLDNGW